MKNFLKKFIGILCMITAVICFIFAFLQYREYEKGNEEYEEITVEFVKEPEDEDDMFCPDWEALFAQNSDLVGWIRIAPEVSYPVVQGDDNSYYLRHGFSREYNVNGCIFMSCYNSPDWTDRNTVVYGHNMRNKSMFGNNNLYAEKTYTQEHPFFYIYTPDGCYTYRIFSTMTVPDDSRPYETALASDEEYASYIDDILNLRDYPIGDVPGTDDRIITLSTCSSNRSRRFVIQGKLESLTGYDGTTVTMEELKAETGME